jgi:hypothetical protein
MPRRVTPQTMKIEEEDEKEEEDGFQVSRLNSRPWLCPPAISAGTSTAPLNDEAMSAV